jgi:hypothetical protein
MIDNTPDLNLEIKKNQNYYSIEDHVRKNILRQISVSGYALGDVYVAILLV